MNKDKETRKDKRSSRYPTNFFDSFFNQTNNRSFENIFEAFEEQFNRMHQQMNETFKQNLTRQQSPTQNMNQPFIYGWSYHVGPDGKPHYQEFSNRKTLSSQPHPKISEKNEPFIDVIDSEKEIYITAELPGIEKENIDLELDKDTLYLTVKHPDRGFNKTIELPTEVNKKPIESKYNNGVLSITLKKRKRKNKGHKINID